MANFENYWSCLCKSSPSLQGDSLTRMTLTVSTFQEQLRRAYEAGTVDKAALIDELKSIEVKKDPFGFGDLKSIFPKL